jgi:hypothetical protein
MRDIGIWTSPMRTDMALNADKRTAIGMLIHKMNIRSGYDTNRYRSTLFSINAIYLDQDQQHSRPMFYMNF